MAKDNFSKGVGNPATSAAEVDPLAKAFIYRLRRDALTIVANLNRGRDVPCMEAMKRQLVFVQGQLCRAAIADPRLPSRVKDALVAFQGSTVAESLEDRRGSRRRGEKTRSAA